ncbi:MAG: site-specific DNA-methyltransferase [Bacteroidaceae bacterium]|nr:site-specific DNA-methyltransferase [Bacteroidaceae bacterium]
MERPERLDLQSADGAQLNLDALYQIAPSCFTEATDPKTGKIKRVVNFDLLRQLLGDDTVEDATEAYEFNWVGKQEAHAEVLRPINKTLRPVKKDSVDWDNTQNLYIEGDNLEVLKLLQKSYLGKVKMIYIDPPYNTGNDFVYHDDSSRSQEEEDLAAGNIDELGNRYRKNTDSNGRFHSEWCSMIYARLMVARSLLTEDGVIFISIGVEELATLKNICNEVFGENNFVEVFSWVKTSTPPSLAVKSRKTNEYILCYEKNKNNIKYNGELLDGGDQPLLNTGNAESVLTFPKDKVIFKPKAFPNGVYEPYCKDRVSLLDRIEIIDGKATTDFRLKGEFKWTQSFFDEEVKNGTTFIIKTDNLSVRFIREGEGYKRPTNFIKEKITSPVIDKPGVGVGTNETASSYLTSLMDGKNVFSYPKPVSLIKYLTNFICKDSDIVMDFFSGSGTTADAVWRYNVENKEVALKYILVQLPENLDENLKTADANSKELLLNGIQLLDRINKPHKLTELAKYRLAKTIDSIKQDNPDCQMDLGFRVFRIDESNFEDVERTPKEYNQDQLDLFLNNVKSDRTDLDLLFGCMLDWGVKLSLPMSSEEVDGKMIYTVNEGDLVACFAEKVTDSVVKAMADKQPLRVIFRDSCFEQDADKINIYETFKQLLDWSDKDVEKNIRVI